MSPRVVLLIVSGLLNIAGIIAIVWLLDKLDDERKSGRALIARIKGQS